MISIKKLVEFTWLGDSGDYYSLDHHHPTRLWRILLAQGDNVDYILRWRTVEKNLSGASAYSGRRESICKIVESLGLKTIRALMTLVADPLGIE